MAPPSLNHSVNSALPQTSSFLLPFIAHHDVIWYGKYLWSVLALSPPNFLPTPAYKHFGEGVGETALVLCKHCPAKPKTFMCYQHHSRYNYKEAVGGLIWGQLHAGRSCTMLLQSSTQLSPPRFTPEQQLSRWPFWDSICMKRMRERHGLGCSRILMSQNRATRTL